MAVPTLWRTKQQRYNLMGEKCPSCAGAVFPPRKVCPHCGDTMTDEHVSGHETTGSFVFHLPNFASHRQLSRVAGDD
ncbi:MAG: hypothetical protein H6642_14535 [Caldilineaceae bacterium]|nr:hypothetical protein [Caldilineaceae bacterium]MCB9139556.1 hypothetical protein [Caldilineaceae bacterium]